MHVSRNSDDIGLGLKRHFLLFKECSNKVNRLYAVHVWHRKVGENELVIDADTVRVDDQVDHLDPVDTAVKSVLYVKTCLVQDGFHGSETEFFIVHYQDYVLLIDHQFLKLFIKLKVYRRVFYNSRNTHSRLSLLELSLVLRHFFLGCVFDLERVEKGRASLVLGVVVYFSIESLDDFL